jgi:hypothetical protein
MPYPVHSMNGVGLLGVWGNAIQFIETSTGATGLSTEINQRNIR